VLADIAADLARTDVKFHSGKLNLHPCFGTGHCVCCRILPTTKTVGQALSSQNVSNRTTS